jgi:hypothetical protein
MVPISTVSTSGIELNVVLNYPFIFFIVVIVIYLLYRYMKKQQIESSNDEGWLDTTESNQ